MENNKNEKNEEVKYEEIGIGEDKPQIVAAKVKIEEYRISSVEKDGKKIGDKLTLLVKHPKVVDRLIEISQAMYQNGDKLKISGIWIKLDQDSKIPFKSCLANVLRNTGVGLIKDLVGKEVDTKTDDNGYLVIKAY